MLWGCGVYRKEASAWSWRVLDFWLYKASFHYRKAVSMQRNSYTTRMQSGKVRRPRWSQWHPSVSYLYRKGPCMHRIILHQDMPMTDIHKRFNWWAGDSYSLCQRAHGRRSLFGQSLDCFVEGAQTHRSPPAAPEKLCHLSVWWHQGPASLRGGISGLLHDPLRNWDQRWSPSFLTLDGRSLPAAAAFVCLVELESRFLLFAEIFAVCFLLFLWANLWVELANSSSCLRKFLVFVFSFNTVFVFQYSTAFVYWYFMSTKCETTYNNHLQYNFLSICHRNEVR